MHNPPTCVSGATELSAVLPRLPLVASLLSTEVTVAMSESCSHSLPLPLQEALPTEPLPLLQHLLSAIANGHTHASSLQEVAQWRERLAIVLGDVVRYMEPALSGSANDDSLRLGVGLWVELDHSCSPLPLTGLATELLPFW